jgi:hypothetical protein
MSWGTFDDLAGLLAAVATGHLPWAEEPADFRAAVARFLTSG